MLRDVNGQRPSILRALAVGAGVIAAVILVIFVIYVIFGVLAMERFGS